MAYDLAMGVVGSPSPRRRARLAPTVLAPALAIAAISVVGIGGQGVERIEMLAQVTSGPAAPRSSDVTAQSGVAGSGLARLEAEALAPPMRDSRVVGGSGDRGGRSSSGRRGGAGAPSSGAGSPRDSPDAASSRTGAEEPPSRTGGAEPSTSSPANPATGAGGGGQPVGGDVSGPVEPVTDAVGGLLGGGGGAPGGSGGPPNGGGGTGGGGPKPPIDLPGTPKPPADLPGVSP